MLNGRLVGAFSVLTNLRMELFQALVMCDVTMSRRAELGPHLEVAVAHSSVTAGAAHVWAQGGAVYRSLEPVGGVVLGTRTIL